MTKNALKIIKKAMDTLGLEYCFMRYNKTPVVYPYWVGEYQENPSGSESGHSTSTFMLTAQGAHRTGRRTAETTHHTLRQGI